MCLWRTSGVQAARSSGKVASPRRAKSGCSRRFFGEPMRCLGGCLLLFIGNLLCGKLEQTPWGISDLPRYTPVEFKTLDFRVGCVGLFSVLARAADDSGKAGPYPGAVAQLQHTGAGRPLQGWRARRSPAGWAGVMLQSTARTDPARYVAAEFLPGREESLW